MKATCIDAWIDFAISVLIFMTIKKKKLDNYKKSELSYYEFSKCLSVCGCVFWFYDFFFYKKLDNYSKKTGYVKKISAVKYKYKMSADFKRRSMEHVYCNNLILLS